MRLLSAVFLALLIACCPPRPDPLPVGVEIPKIQRPVLPIEKIKPGSTDKEYIKVLFDSLAIQIAYTQNLERIISVLTVKEPKNADQK